MDKVAATALGAVADVPDGASLEASGFGLSGVPGLPIQGPHERRVSGLPVVFDHCGAMDSGLAVPLPAGRTARVLDPWGGAIALGPPPPMEPPAPGASAPSPVNSPARAANSASPPSASAWARAWPSSLSARKR